MCKYFTYDNELSELYLLYSQQLTVKMLQLYDILYFSVLYRIKTLIVNECRLTTSAMVAVKQAENITNFASEILQVRSFSCDRKGQVGS